MIERIHAIEITQRGDSGRIDAIEDNAEYLWTDFKQLQQMVGNIRVDVAKIVVLSTIAQTVLTGAVVYFFTKGQ